MTNKKNERSKAKQQKVAARLKKQALLDTAAERGAAMARKQTAAVLVAKAAGTTLRRDDVQVRVNRPQLVSGFGLNFTGHSGMITDADPTDSFWVIDADPTDMVIHGDFDKSDQTFWADMDDSVDPA